jgi:metallo-beta-lactamase family protein
MSKYSMLMEEIQIHCLGGVDGVTGSKFVIETPEVNLMIDCGLFQGLKSLRLSNWLPINFDASAIDAVLLTHGHLDHVGYLPRLVKQGFQNPIYASAPTLKIAEIILRDSAKINEEEAEKANLEGYSKHLPAKPLYNTEDVEKTLRLFRPVRENLWTSLSANIRYRFRYAGHILGACFIELQIFDKRFVFSGDLGRKEDVLLREPDIAETADYLFIETTYGDRKHPEEDVDGFLRKIILNTLTKKSTLIIPSFAVERAQSLMFRLWKLVKQNKVPPIRMVLDSPMGHNVLGVFEQHADWHNLSLSDCREMSKAFQIVENFGETWEIIDTPGAKIVIAGSGMLSGGRVLTYLQQYLDNPETDILLVGFMAEGTRGRKLLEGAEVLKIYGKYYPVKAALHQLDSLSAHADQSGLIEWIQSMPSAPKKIFLTHGEPAASETFKGVLAKTYTSEIIIPKLYDVLSFSN